MIQRGRRIAVGLSVVLVALSLLPSPAGAQDGGSWFCVRGAPPPGCRGFIRIEVRGGGAMAEPGRLHFTGPAAPGGGVVPQDTTVWFDFGDWIGGELGYAVNTGDRWAFGGSVALETGNETTRWLLRGRARRWLHPRIYAEVLPGLFRQRRDLLYRSGDGLEANTGFTVEARVGWSNVVFAEARYDVMEANEVLAPVGTPGYFHWDPGGATHAFSLGGGLEGRTAIYTGTAILLIGAAWVLIGGGPVA